MRADDPRHGQYRGYQQHLRDGEKPSAVCLPCHEAGRAYQRVRPHLHALGRPPRVPMGEKAHDNIVRLAERMTLTEISTVTGIHDSQLRYVLDNGPTGIVLRRSRVRYEALDVAAILGQHLSHIGAVRRIRALHAIGYTAGPLAAETGLCTDAIVTLRDRATWSSATTRRKVADAYERLCMKPQPRDKITARAMNLAARSGWAPPLAWDDIDDPTERPNRGSKRNDRPKTDLDPVVVERVLAGDRLPMTRAERVEVVRTALARGWSEAEIEARTGITKATDKSRFARPDEEDAA